MSFTHLLKSTGLVHNENFSPSKSQHAEIDGIYRGYLQNPYIAQQSEMYDNIYHPGYIPNNGYELKYGSASGGYGGDQGYGIHHYPPPHGGGYGEAHTYDSGHSHGYNQPRHKSKGNNAAMSALTLLAFLFFLNILQSCLKEHMMTMNPTVMVMTAGASRIQRLADDHHDVELRDSESDYTIYTPKEDMETDSEPGVIKSDDDFHKVFNESNIKFQNANNYYSSKPKV